MKLKQAKRFSPPAFISRLLREAGIPKPKKLNIRYKNGVVTARVTKHKYE